MKKETSAKVACCSRSQKIWGVVALAGLFACGLFVGATMNVGQRSVKQIAMSETQCAQIANSITQVATGSVLAQCSGDECIKKLRELNAVYEKNCVGRVFEVKEPEPAPRSEDTAETKKACEIIETVFGRELVYPESDSIAAHSNNIDVFKKLLEYGCPENVDYVKEQIQKETAIIEALKSKSDNLQTCAEIESLLMQSLPTYNLNDSDIRIERAKIYANLSERGCVENSQQYVNLAAKELEIARALRDDKFSQVETVDVVETYKRLEMKQAANEVLDKVQKLTDPAIDFIIQVQKIIEE